MSHVVPGSLDSELDPQLFDDSLFWVFSDRYQASIYQPELVLGY